MASGLTNIGKIRLLEMALRNTMDSAAMDTAAGQWYLALSTSAASLTALTLTFDTATQIVSDTAGGYTDGGAAMNRDSTDWDTLDDDTASSFGYIRFKDQVWTATGGNLPRSGTGAFYAVMLDDNATIGSRQVYAWWDLTTARSVGSGATLTLQDLEIRLT